MFTEASLVHVGAGPDLVNKVFLPPAWRRSMGTIKSPPLPTANRKIVSVKEIVPLFRGSAGMNKWTGKMQ